jgi:uncharacterized protein YkwD
VPNTSKPVAAALLSLSLFTVGATASPALAHAQHHRRHAAARHTRVAKRVEERKRAKALKTHLKPRKQAAAPTHTIAPKAVEKVKETPLARRQKIAGETAAASIASVLATPCENTEVTPTLENLPQLRSSVLCLVNKVRAEHGVSPLIVNADLEKAAEEHCAELISVDYFAHVAPDGETPVDRIEQTGYVPGSEVGYVIGENLAWGTYQLSTPESIVKAWVASPGHLANILESRYTETGIGITPSVPESLAEGNPGATYAQEFGVIIH